MKLIQLVQMVEISKTGSMNKAAQNLFISQPNLSASMKDLENELNASIFTRSHKGVELTNIGKKVLKYAKSILKDVENIKTLTTNDSEKNLLTLNISAPTLLFVQDVFSKLCLKYASHPAKFNLRTGNNPDIINDLVLKKSNLGIVVFSNDR